MIYSHVRVSQMQGPRVNLEIQNHQEQRGEPVGNQLHPCPAVAVITD